MDAILIYTGVILSLLIKGNEAQLGVCGTAPLNTKIVGGQDSTPGSWPWQVSLQQDGSHFCGGSLINNMWVMTAAHCFPSYISPSNVIVYIGREKQQGINNNEVSTTLRQAIIHPSYNSTTHDNDIALLELSRAITFTNYIQPVCLAADGSGFSAGANTWVTGWGQISSGVALPSPQTLQEVQIPIVSNSDCNSNYNGVITNNMICAGLASGGKDSCQGDSGGPMVIQNGTTWVQAGIVSFGIGCARPNTPGVYTRVSVYQDWIKSQISTNQPGFVLINAASSIGPIFSFSLTLLISFLPVVFSRYLLS